MVRFGCQCMYCKKFKLHKYTYIYILFFALVYSFTTSVYALVTTNKQCLVYTDDLKKAKNILFVDVRNGDSFNKKNITGSINIPPDLIKTKTFLKNKNIILIGTGWNKEILIEQCIQLKKQGFKSVNVLAGGILNGVRLDYFNKSSLTPFRMLISLTPNEFFNNKSEKKFVPFVISNESQKQIKTALPHAKIFPLKTNKRQLLKGLKKIGKGTNPIVIFSENSVIVDEAIADYLGKPLRQIYYFKGGFNAYKKVNDLNKMTALSNKNKRFSTKKPVSCAN